jgi:hypothetical protein
MGRRKYFGGLYQHFDLCIVWKATPISREYNISVAYNCSVMGLPLFICGGTIFFIIVGIILFFSKVTYLLIMHMLSSVHGRDRDL